LIAFVLNQVTEIPGMVEKGFRQIELGVCMDELRPCLSLILVTVYGIDARLLCWSKSPESELLDFEMAHEFKPLKWLF
jgi:hypothetical protein